VKGGSTVRGLYRVRRNGCGHGGFTHDAYARGPAVVLVGPGWCVGTTRSEGDQLRPRSQEDRTGELVEFATQMSGVPRFVPLNGADPPVT
jgi:hypothetical protein